MRATLSAEEAAAAAAEAASVARHGGRPMDGFGRSWLTLPEALAKRPGYTHVVILGGTNDLATALLASHRELPGQVGEAQPGEHYAVPVLAHLRRLHEAAQATGAVSVAVTVPEVAFETSEERVRAMRLEVNRGLKLLAKSYPRGAMLVADAVRFSGAGRNVTHASALQAEAMPQSGMDPEAKKARWDDGLHFSPAGYDQLAAVILEALGTQGCGGNGTAGRALKRTPEMVSSMRTDV